MRQTQSFQVILFSFFNLSTNVYFQTIDLPTINIHNLVLVDVQRFLSSVFWRLAIFLNLNNCLIGRLNFDVNEVLGFENARQFLSKKIEE